MNMNTANRVAPTQKLFGDWKRARSAKYLTRQQWLENRRSVKNTETAAAVLDDGERQFQLFSEAQTTALRSDLADRCELIAKFVKYSDMFGYLSRSESRILQLPTDEMFGGVKQLIYRSLDYKTRHKGIRIATRWTKTKDYADKIYLRAPRQTNWFVLDLDNHLPTVESTVAHLKLLQHLVYNMKTLQARFGQCSVFYDYQQDCPQGIHIWVSLRTRLSTGRIHLMARKFLASIADPGLDKELIQNGLKPIAKLEILPSEKLLMQFFGSAGREVFTTSRLTPVNEAFDSTSLLKHLKEWNCGGDPTERYGSLALLAVDQPHQTHSIPVVEVEPQVALCGSSVPSKDNKYFTRLVDLCLRGVMVPDELFTSCLRPLATALWFRELHNHPDKKKLINKYLLEWIQKKHNGNVSRVKKGAIRALSLQINHVVGHLDKTPLAIQTYWQKVRINDEKYPQRTLSLIEAMQTEWNPTVVVSQKDLGAIQQILGQSGSNSRGSIYTHCIAGHFTSTTNPEIPQSVLAQLDKHLLLNNQRKGKANNRKREFCVNFIRAIGPTGQKRLCQNKLNQIGGYKINTQPKTLRRYKKLLQQANILKTVIKLIPHKQSRLYELENWVVAAWNEHPPPHHQIQ